MQQAWSYKLHIHLRNTYLLDIFLSNWFVQVPIGAATIESPSGQMYDVLWRQADDGPLQIQDYRLALPCLDE